MPQEYKYRAFISYSHDDEKWASWLHETLETYKVPKTIIGRETRMGVIPARLAPVFRDRDELPTATNLGEVLTQALIDSATQIVICSPAAAKSRWVNEEILTYKRLGRADRIFCLIVDGEPGAANKPGMEDRECFPPAVRFEMGEDGELTDIRIEPIAADTRLEGDGRTNARLKLIAGMLGVGFDALKQREANRRHRRMVAFTAVAFVGMAITSGLALTAYMARIEAEEQRNRAQIEAETARQTTQFMVDLFKVSDPSEALGNTITAREILDQGAARIDEELSNQPEIQATLMDTMGSVYTSLGLYEEASALLQNALTMRRNVHGEEHLAVARTHDSLGDVLSLRADYPQAGRHFESALAIRMKLLGVEDPEVADSLAGLAEVLTLEGKFEEAEPLLRRALDMRVATLGENSFEVADSTERLGLNLFDQGNLDAAESYLRQAIDIRRNLTGGEPHPDLANGLNDLGFLLYDKGEFEDTEVLWREALAMNRRLLEPTHPDIAYNLFNLAAVSHDKGDFDKAEELYREVLDIRRQALGNDHPDIALTLNNYAFVLYDRGDRQSAIEMEESAVQMYRKFFPDGHPALARALATLGGWLTREKAFAAAEPLLRESLVMRRKFLGDRHPEVAGGMTRMAYLYLHTNRAELAQLNANSARTMFSELLPPGHWRTAWATCIEGAALKNLQQFAAAEKLLLEGYETLKDAENSGSSQRYIDESRGFLIDLYEVWGKPVQAKKYAALMTTGTNR